MSRNVQAKFGGKRGRSFRLRLSDDLMVVRTLGQRSVRDHQVSEKTRDALCAFDTVFSIPEVGIEVFKCIASRAVRATRDRAKHALRTEQPVRFAGRGLSTPGGRPVLYTENLFVQFAADVTQAAVKRMLSDAGLKAKRALDYAVNAWFVEQPEGTGYEKLFETAADLLAREEVILCHPELVQEMALRAAFPQQWHLKRTNIAGNTINQHANVESAWELSEGEGVTIAVIDDGVDMAHREFSGAGKIVSPRDVTRGNDDPSPGPRDSHGTACAGVACANGARGASGVAPRARLMPIRLASNLGSQAEANAFVWAADHGADVISCSWGPVDGTWWDPNDPAHNDVVPLPDSTRLAIDYAIERGRAGKGCVVTWAAGNGNEPVDNDGYASYEKVIAVAACNDVGEKAAYSDTGEAIWCAFPSSDGRPSLTPGIWTTDVSGNAGYNRGSSADGDAEGDYTNSFGGTSSACPGVAGVAALVIARNPDLRWDQVKLILKESCDRIDEAGGDYGPNGHSPKYGYGRVNARRAVALAVPSSTSYDVLHKATQSVPIKDGKTSRIRVAVGDVTPIRNVQVHVDLEHTWIGDLVVRVKPPAGLGVTAVTLHDRADRGTHNIHRVYDLASTPGLAALMGQNPQGEWQLEVSDQAARDEGRIISFGVELSF